MEGSQDRSVDHGARRIKRNQIALVPVVVVTPTFNVQLLEHSRTGLGQTKQTGRPH